jgi:hypothetical protein
MESAMTIVNAEVNAEEKMVCGERASRRLVEAVPNSGADGDAHLGATLGKWLLWSLNLPLGRAVLRCPQ